MDYNTTSLILVGMPGAGKSTVGLLLAKELAMDFVDTDILIQLREGKTLQDIIDSSGYMVLRQIEEEVLLATDYPQHVIATGGSAVYSQAAMNHLRQFGRVVFLDVPLELLRQRIHNYDTRGIARRPEQSLLELFAERRALYQQVADILIDCRDLSPAQLVQEIIYAEAEQFAEVDA